MQVEFLIDAPEFWARLRADLLEAAESVLVQTLSFEADRAGSALARALERTPAPDRLLLLDSYSLVSHDDRFVGGPAWLEKSFRRDVMHTHRWVRRLRTGGTQVRVGNPLWRSPLNIVRSNHKKMAVIDERVTYLGGINFCDHNFRWHDMMLRVESAELARLLAADFRASWDGHGEAWDRTVGALRILSLNGRGNRKVLSPLLDAIAGARRTIDVVSAYLTYPFTGILGATRARGVRVRVLTPADNNQRFVARHMVHSAHRHDLEVYHSPGMSHMKAMLIDGEQLVTGSINFDFLSYFVQDELVVMTREPSIVHEFIERVWTPDLASASRAPNGSDLGSGSGIL